MTTFTGKSEIGVSQVTNSGTTSNDADTEIVDAFANPRAEVVGASNAFTITNVSATFLWERNVAWRFTDDASPPTALITVTVPATPARGVFGIINATGQDMAVTITSQPLAAPVIIPGGGAILSNDGTNVELLSSSSIETFAQLADTPASITADQFVKGNAGGTALEFGTLPNALNVSPSHLGALLARTGTHSVPDAAEETIPWQAATYDTTYDPGDGGLPQRFWLGVNTSFVDGDVTTGTDIVAETAHSYATGEGPVRLTTSGVLPTGLALATNYWLIAVDANTIAFAATRADAIADNRVDITLATGGGTHTLNHEEILIVPAKVAKVRVKGSVEMAAGTNPVNRYLTIHKNFAEVQGVKPQGMTGAITSGWLDAETATLEVSEGDVFELVAFQDSDGAVNVANDVATHFSMEVVEEARAFTYPGVTVTPPYRGGRTTKSVDQSMATGGALAKITFDGVAFDPEGLFDDANDRLIVPAGVTKVRISGNVQWENGGTGGRHVVITRNGAGTSGPGTSSSNAAAGSLTFPATSVQTGVLEVVEGDYFELSARHNQGSSRNIIGGDATWLEMEIIETNEAAFPPEPLKAHITTADRLVVSSTVAMWLADRRLSLADDFAGSLGRAKLGPNGGSVVYDVQVEGVSIGSITFADSTGAPQTATFSTTAAAVEVVNIDELLEIIAPANIQSMDDVAFTLQAWRS